MLNFIKHVFDVWDLFFFSFQTNLIIFSQIFLLFLFLGATILLFSVVYHLWVSWVLFFCGNSLQHGLWVFCSHFPLAHYGPRTNFYAYFLGLEFPNCSLNLYSKFPEERYQVQILQEAFSFPLLKPEIDKWAELLGNFFSAPFSCDHSSFQGLILGQIFSLGAGLLGFASCSRCELTSTPLLPLAHCYSIPSSAPQSQERLPSLIPLLISGFVVVLFLTPS